MFYLLHLLTVAAIQIPVILGYNFVLGKGKILHFGHVGTAIVAAYSITITLQSTGSWWIAAIVGAACIAVTSAIFAWMALKLESDGFGILSIAVHLALLAVVLTATELTRGALGIPGVERMPGLESNTVFAIVVVLVAVLFIVFSAKVNGSSFGRSLQALSESRNHAESLGIRRSAVFLLAFMIAGLGTFITNLFYAQYLGLLHPSDYHFPALIFMVMAVVAGGPGSVRGVTIASVLLVALKESLRFLPLPLGLRGPLLLLLFGVILVAAVYLRRDTIFPKVRKV